MTAGGKIGAGKRPTITAAMKLEVLRKNAVFVTCPGCFREVGLAAIEFDHIQALVDGGAHSVQNLRPLCGQCHKPKSAFEHKRNSKSKRISKACEVHKSVVRGEIERPAGKIKSGVFRGWKKFNGEPVLK